MSDPSAELLELREQNANLRTAKEGYKKIALQAVKDFEYMKKIVPGAFIDRRADEIKKEVASVQDQA